MTTSPDPTPAAARADKLGFRADFRRFFLRGLAALMPTLITLWLLVKIWDFLWDSLGQYMIWLGVRVIDGQSFILPQGKEIEQIRNLDLPPWLVEVIGVLLAVILVYTVGLFVGNLIGRSMWRLAEAAVLRIPVIRAVYPAVKQVTDYLLSDRTTQFAESRVVAVRPHEAGIWSIGLVTGPGLTSLDQATGQEMVTVFVPSSPTAFSGYVLVVPRKDLIELPLKVEEAMRLLISGGVIHPSALPPSPALPAIKSSAEAQRKDAEVAEQVQV